MMIKISKSEALKALQSAGTSGQLVFLTGAGISKIPPANLPLGNEIKDQLIEFITASTELKDYREKILASDRYKQLIPELLFQAIYESIGDKIFSVYGRLNSNRYNRIHQLLAYYVKNFRAIVYTTNFDELVEKSSDSKIKIDHLHGSIRNPESMVIRIYQVGRGIPAKIFKSFQIENNSKTLFVVGYSGNDKDVIALLNNTRFKAIYWLMRDFDDQWTLKNLIRIKSDRLFVFKGDIQTIFSDLITGAKLAAIKPVPEQQSKTDFSDVTFAEAMRCIQSIFYITGSYKEAVTLCGLMIDKYSDKLKLADLAWFHYVLGDNLVYMGNDFVSAEKHIQSGITISKDQGALLDVAEGLSAMGNLLAQRDSLHPNKAKESLLEALKVAGQLDDKNLTAGEKDQLWVLKGKIYNNLGLSLHNERQFWEAISNYRQSIQFKRKAGNIAAIAVTAANISIAYLAVGNRNYLRWKKQAEETFIQYSLDLRLAYLYRELGHFTPKRNKRLALKLLEDALNLYEPFGEQAALDVRITRGYVEQFIH